MPHPCSTPSAALMKVKFVYIKQGGPLQPLELFYSVPFQVLEMGSRLSV
jgi:hypothetical protein